MFAVGELINVLQRGNASVDRVNEILRYKADVESPQNPIQVNDLSEIHFKNVQFSYPFTTSNQLELNDLSVIKGETIGVVGKQVRVKRRYLSYCSGSIRIGKEQLLFQVFRLNKLDLTQLRN